MKWVYLLFHLLFIRLIVKVRSQFTNIAYYVIKENPFSEFDLHNLKCVKKFIRHRHLLDNTSIVPMIYCYEYVQAYAVYDKPNIWTVNN